MLELKVSDLQRTGLRLSPRPTALHRTAALPAAVDVESQVSSAGVASLFTVSGEQVEEQRARAGPGATCSGRQIGCGAMATAAAAVSEQDKSTGLGGQDQVALQFNAINRDEHPFRASLDIGGFALAKDSDAAWATKRTAIINHLSLQRVLSKLAVAHRAHQDTDPVARRS